MDGNEPGPKRDQYQIKALLIADLNAANQRRKRTEATFLQATDGVPHHSPSAGLLVIKQASDARRRAFTEYQTALKRFTDFTVDGIVPNDLD
jgi:hypothetical protein